MRTTPKRLKGQENSNLHAIVIFLRLISANMLVDWIISEVFMERALHPDGLGSDSASTPQDQYLSIARALYFSIAYPFASCSRSGTIDLHDVPNSSTSGAILSGLGIKFEPGQDKLNVFEHLGISEFIVQFAAPIQAIASGRSMPLTRRNAPLVKPMFDKVSAAIAETSPEAERIINQANSTSGFWEWVAQQTSQRATEHPRVAASRADEGRSGGR